MDEDASLEEFAAGTAVDSESTGSSEESTGSTGSTDAEVDSESTTSEDNPQSGADSEEAVAPTVSTYRYSPKKDACGACETRVRRRWRDGDGLVCGDCKEW
jgi:hypothetical protein